MSHSQPSQIPTSARPASVQASVRMHTGTQPWDDKAAYGASKRTWSAGRRTAPLFTQVAAERQGVYSDSMASGQKALTVIDRMNFSTATRIADA